MKNKLFYTSLFILNIQILTAQATVGLLNYNTEQTQEGYNLLFPHNQAEVFLTDNCGRIVHKWTDNADFRPGNAVYLLENGNLVKCKRPNFSIEDPIWAGGGGATVEVRTWDNELIASFEQNDSLYRLHHDVAPLPNGNILMILWEFRSFEESEAAGRDTSTMAQGKLWSEVIWEWDPVKDTIVWEWKVWDHLIQDHDATKDNFGVVADHPELININYDEHDGHPDWLHINAIDYNPVLDQLILSVPYFNEVWVIDHSTSTEAAAGHEGGNANKGGDLLYRFGNPMAYDNGALEEKMLFFQHDIQWVNPNAVEGDADFGVLAAYNNRYADGISPAVIWNSFPPGETNYTREMGRFGPQAFDRQIVHPDTPTIASSTGLSSVQQLANGNYLILAGRFGYAFEINVANEVVWEYRIPIRGGSPIAQGTELSTNNNITFSMKRYTPDFAGFNGRDLTPGDFWEINPIVSNCPLAVSSTELLDPEERLKVYPNPGTEHFYFELDDWQNSYLEIFSLSGKRIHIQTLEGKKTLLSIKNWSPGMYFFKIKGQTGKLLVK